MASSRYFPTLLLLPILAAPVLAHAAPTYSTVEIARSNSIYGPVSALGLNNSGTVVGRNGYYGEDTYSYSAGTKTTLPGESYYKLLGNSINDAGQIVGRLNDYNNNYAFVYANGGFSVIGGPGSIGTDINNSGQVVGEALDGRNTRHAFLYTNGATQDLGTLGGKTSYAKALNDSGQVVGGAATVDGRKHAFVYSAGGMADLGTFGGAHSEATGINNAGQVVGNAQTSDGFYHAFLYANGVMTDLNSLIGGTTSYATQINNAGQILIRGNSQTSGYETRDYLYSNGALLALDTLIDPSLNLFRSYATGLNDKGQITMNGLYNVGNTELSMAIRLDPLSPVPEPATYGMLLGGLGLIGCMARRKARAA